MRGIRNIFGNNNTLELDLFEEGYAEAMLATLREARLGKERRDLLAAWAEHHDSLDPEKFLSIVEFVGKGRFAQRLASQIGDLQVPTYIASAIKFVADRV